MKEGGGGFGAKKTAQNVGVSISLLLRLHLQYMIVQPDDIFSVIF
jgi:hypothetical protein